MLERPHLDGLFSLCRGEKPSAQTHLPGTRAFRRYDTLVITGQPMQTAPQPAELWPDRPVTFGAWVLELRTQPGQGMAIPYCELPVTVRSRRAGDTISLAYGRKSVKKLLIERKIPKDLRDTVPILCNNEKILAVGDLCAAQLPGDKKLYIICRRKEI